MNTAILSHNRFSDILRQWRRGVGVSQLELALRSGSSQKHISFLESGRSNPSRMMIVALSDALDIPLRDRNELMLAAGFAPRYNESSLTDPELAPVQQAVDQILEGQMPYPVLVFDRFHNSLAANGNAIKFLAWLFDTDDLANVPIASNVVRGLLHPDGYRRHISNWELVASIMLRRLRAETLATGPTTHSEELFKEVSEYGGIPADWRTQGEDSWRLPMLTINVKKDGQAFSLFSTLTSLGAAFDVTLQEIRIESFFPADEAAKAFFEQL
ncbi:helix-turn-helix domain-containing protein [Sphingorhabdus sp. Alg231-15]|uniref:helix-turn-helix domain-containing protein n=1 Tax=Sphingorhabdus sp. Alg231-15 TaxID=1922222 RepID=UPI00307BC456